MPLFYIVCAEKTNDNYDSRCVIGKREANILCTNVSPAAISTDMSTDIRLEYRSPDVDRTHVGQEREVGHRGLLYKSAAKVLGSDAARRSL